MIPCSSAAYTVEVSLFSYVCYLRGSSLGRHCCGFYLVVDAAVISINEYIGRRTFAKFFMLIPGYFQALCNPDARSLPPCWYNVGWDKFLFFKCGASSLVETSVDILQGHQGCVCLPWLVLVLMSRNPAKLGIFSVERILLTVSELFF